MTFRELRSKEVVDCCDGRRLGCVTDLEFCPKTGKIHSIIVMDTGHFWSCLCGEKKIVIPSCNIVQIGPDVIVVEYQEHRKKNG